MDGGFVMRLGRRGRSSTAHKLYRLEQIINKVIITYV